MTLEELSEAVAQGTVDTVLLAMTDMQGRLQGKRLTATHFLAEVAEHGAEGCNYLLAVDVDMTHRRRLRDVLVGARLRRLGAASRTSTRCARCRGRRGRSMCLADVAWLDGSDVVASPRQILRRQLARLAERGWSANAGTELEFMVFRDTYEEAWHKGYRELRPANLYNVDYSLLGTARVEPLIRRIRNSMAAAGMVVEDSKGECNFGQHEINFRYADALRTADEHVDLQERRQGDRRRRRAWRSRFMAKYDQREGNSCHIHFSLADEQGPLFERDRGAVRVVPRRAARVPARADAAAGAERQLLQALRRRPASRRRPSPGATTTARARCASSATARRCASRTASAAPT